MSDSISNTVDCVIIDTSCANLSSLKFAVERAGYAVSVTDDPAKIKAADKVFLILNTDDFWRDFNAMQSKGVAFLETPREEVYGTVAIFRDKFGNKWDLIQTT